MLFLHALTLGAWEPHGHCFSFAWQVLIPMVIGHTLISSAYFAIPALLLRGSERVRAFFYATPEVWALVPWFAAFIVCCSISHLFSVWNVWHADYQASSLWLFWTGIVSWRTVVLMPAAGRAFDRLLEERRRLAEECHILSDRLAAYQDPLDDETKFVLGKLASMGRVVH